MALFTTNHEEPLYRLVGVIALRDALQSKYLERDTFRYQSVVVEGREALLVLGHMQTERVKWGGPLHELTGVEVPLGNRVAAGVLVIRSEASAAWALTYGMGFQVLDADKVDSGFGQRVAVRAADPTALSSLTRTTLDQRPRIDRLSIPSGEHLRGFGVGDVGELVTRLVARATIPGLVGAREPTTLRGADALNVPLGRTAADLVADLDYLGALLSQPPAPELEALEQMVAVKRPSDIAQLETRLVEDLRRPEQEGLGRLGISWPTERADEHGTGQSHRFIHAGRDKNAARDAMPSIHDVEELLKDVAEADRLAWLKRVKIQLFSDASGHDAVSNAIPVYKWLAYETDLNGDRYCLHDGRWYQLGQDYALKVTKRADEILARRPPYDGGEACSAHRRSFFGGDGERPSG